MPLAPQKPHILEKHGHQRIDPWYWLNDRENPEVIAYLEAENAWTEQGMAHTKVLQEELFQEMKGRIKEDDSSVPFFYRGYWYYNRFEEGKEYPIYCRKNTDLEASEELMLDVNSLAEGQPFCNVAGAYTVSLDGNLLAYSLDTVGRRIYELRVKDLGTGVELPDRIPGMTGNAVWAADNKTLFYTKRHLETLRSYQVWKHRLGENPEHDELVFEEKDETFYIQISRSKSEKYLLIHCSATVSDEVRLLPSDQPDAAWTVFLPRERGHEYSLEHAGDHFYIRSNRNARNFKLMRCQEFAQKESSWETLVAHREDTLLENLEVFQHYIALEERSRGLTHIRLLYSDGRELSIPVDEEVYMLGLGYNPGMDGDLLRYTYASLTSPLSVFDYERSTGVRHLRKRQPVLGDFDAGNYISARLWATASDGTRVPISVVRHRNAPVDGTSPLLLYGYGSYGHSIDPYFSNNHTASSLLDRGFIFAIAHIRGGEEMGRSWYEDSRQLHKMNTFTDFIACGEHLVATGYADPNRLYAMGGSAEASYGGRHNEAGACTGSWLRCLHDVVTTMLDDSIPLTTGEYGEWGNRMKGVLRVYSELFSI
ncbi:MAG: S9 family peptidase [Bacteroidia bacterium]